MEIITEKLTNKVEQINDYLGSKIEQEPSYHDFIQELRSTIANFQQTKIKIKFVSKFVTLAEQLKQISQQQFTTRSSYQFQTVSDVTQINNILKDCDLLCLVRYSKANISKLDKQLIRQAIKRNIYQTVLNVHKVKDDNYKINESNYSYIDTWLTQENYHKVKLFFLCFNSQKKWDSSEGIKEYYYFLESLLLNREAKLEAEINQAITLKASQLLSQQKKYIWRQIQEKKRNLDNQQQEYCQQKPYLLLQKNKKEQQKKFKKIKQKILQEKINIVNPFIPDSLIYKVSKLVEEAEVNLFKENHNQYLYLVVKQKNFAQRLNTVIIDLCQEELSKWVEEKWQEVNEVYASLSLSNYAYLNQNELEYINEFLVEPNFELTNFVSLILLEESSQTVFDYHFFESSQFRLAVTIVFGLVVYFLTGRFFGFVFCIFQIINFLTGKDVRTMKLKQQTKQLRQKLDNKYQSLVRFLSDRASQLLISALENKNQKYQELMDNLTEESKEQLTKVKQEISQHQEKLNNLKQDEIEILSLLE